nr:alcohol dehydrogenase catalytic domain-containing protein [Haladaptatus sp. R4]
MPRFDAGIAEEYAAPNTTPATRRREYDDLERDADGGDRESGESDHHHAFFAVPVHGRPARKQRNRVAEQRGRQEEPDAGRRQREGVTDDARRGEDAVITEARGICHPVTVATDRQFPVVAFVFLVTVFASKHERRCGKYDDSGQRCLESETGSSRRFPPILAFPLIRLAPDVPTAMSDTMRAVEVDEPGGEFELVEREVPTPDATQVRVEVEACGVCHSDSYAKEGGYPGLAYPRVPGHEIVGRVDAVGEDVEQWEEGDRVGAGWHAGHCFTCEACRRGEFEQCENADIHGVTVDGGYAEFAVVNAEALAAVPDELDAADAAPLLCAGITTYNALRHTDARPGDLVAVQGIGGLGHLGVQYARQAGFETVAISRGTDKEEYARELGADHFIDAKADDPAEELQKLGGATVVLATAPNADAIPLGRPRSRHRRRSRHVGVPRRTHRRLRGRPRRKPKRGSRVGVRRRS